MKKVHKIWPRLTSYCGLLVLIVLLASLFRLPFLSEIPPLLLQDEAAIGYNAITIAQTGKDEYGTVMPLTFKSFGDEKPPLYIYATAVMYHLFGWFPSLPRIVSALAGIGSVIVIAGWIGRLTQSKTLGLLAALILAVSPWSIHLSRMGLESNLGLFLFLLGLFTWEQIKSRTRLAWSLVPALFFSLSAYSFHSYRAIVIGIMVAIAVLTPKKKMALTVLFLTSIIVLPGLINQQGMTRFNQTLLVNPQATEQLFNLHRNSCHVVSNGLIREPFHTACILIWNKYTYPVHIIGQSLLDHLSPAFLFFAGDATFNRNPVGDGEMYPFLFPIFVVGVLLGLKHKPYHWLLAGFVIALIPAVLTGPPHSTRLSAQLPFVVASIILGVQWLQKRFKPTIPLVVIGLLISSAYFSLQYSIATYANSHEFLGHSRELALIMYRYWNQGYTVYLDQDVIAEPYIFFAFWNHLDPNQYHTFNQSVSTDAHGFSRPTQLGDRLYFQSKFDIQQLCREGNGGVVYITNQELPYTPDLIIKNHGESLHLAKVYDVTKIKPNVCPNP
jgi:hypothetical protein